ncbi:unnamed protein product [Trichogramma brassicae]|uniref:DNA/RNA-binding domain-containing protein n=1 Tax=Trichogramma brassicae TaxID=86971 RepID=A0A6H5I6J1_9HYME|nr:unnamed protein product [Trichogramma brassicae]
MGVKTVNEMHLEFQEVRKHIEHLSESDVLSSLVWTLQRKYLNLGKMIIITDLQYALRCMVEQELWNYGFKNFISILQKMSKNEKNSQRSDAQCIFTKALDEANGFYLTLLDHFCLSYDLKVPFRRNKYMGIDSENYTRKNSDKNFKSLCYFICTHCLVHLGDLERYRNQLNEAELFYRHAQSVSPTSGHAYNQLALLDVIRLNKLGTVFHYVQAIMCQHPFGPSIPNLFRTLETVHDLNITDPYINLTQDELINIFLYFHKILHANANAQKRSGLVKFLNLRILAQVATNSFSSSILLQMFVINLFSIDYLKLCPTNDCKSKLSGEQQKAKQDILKLIVGQLDAMLLTNYTITDSLIGNNALPTNLIPAQKSLETSYSDLQDDFHPSYFNGKYLNKSLDESLSSQRLRCNNQNCVLTATSTPTPSIDNEDSEVAYRPEYGINLEKFSTHFSSHQKRNNEISCNSSETSVILGHGSTNVRKENTIFQLGLVKESSSCHGPSEHNQNTSIHTEPTEKKLKYESNQEAIKEEYRSVLRLESPKLESSSCHRPSEYNQNTSTHTAPTEKKLKYESNQEVIKEEYRSVLRLESPKESSSPDSSRQYNRNRDLTVASMQTALTEKELSFGSIDSPTSEESTKLHSILSIEPTKSNSSSHCDASCKLTDASMHTASTNSELNREIIEPNTSKSSIESSNLNSSRRYDRNRELTNVSMRAAAVAGELINECFQEAVKEEYRNANFTEFYWPSKLCQREDNQVSSIQANIRLDSVSIINRNSENRACRDIRVFLTKLILFELLLHLLLLPFLVLFLALAPSLLRFDSKKYDTDTCG